MPNQPVVRLRKEGVSYMRKSVIILIAVVVLLGGLAAYLVFVPGATNLFRRATAVTDPQEAASMAVAGVESPYKDDYGMTRITGWVDNRTADDFKSVSIKIQLLDQGGNRKELVDYTVEDVPAGSRKTFDANAGSIDGSRSAKLTVSKVEVYR